MDSPYHYPITIRLESVEPINGEEMFVARCEHFPELAMIENMWAVNVAVNVAVTLVTHDPKQSPK